MFFGHHKHAVDSKGRLSIPKRFLEPLAEPSQRRYTSRSSIESKPARGGAESDTAADNAERTALASGSSTCAPASASVQAKAKANPTLNRATWIAAAGVLRTCGSVVGSVPAEVA